MTYDGFTCVVEMLIKMKKMNFKIKEIPMLLRSAERVGKSKMPICKTIFEYIKLCIKGV
jgi:dolichol-phosphate mannosyltransferase